MDDKVSIIVPIYNVEKYLARCVDSLLAQIHQNIEIILVDDCSTDTCAKIALGYSKKWPHICKFVQRERNGGLSAARNTGIEVASGKWLVFVDSDDWVKDNHVSLMLDIANQDHADIVLSGCTYIWDSGKTVEMEMPISLTTKSTHKDKVALCRCSSTAKLIKASLFKSTGIRFPEDIWRCEDISTIIPIITSTDKISIIHEPLYFYYQRNTSISNQNHSNVDVSFYPKTIQRMLELSQNGFEKELEFRAITELMYGMIMIMVRSGKGKYEICREVDRFHLKYPGWQRNSYLVQLPKGKRIFINCVRKKMYFMLKCLIMAWDAKRRMIG